MICSSHLRLENPRPKTWNQRPFETLCILHYLVNKCHQKYVILTMKDLDISLSPCRQLLGARRHSHHTGNIIVVRAHQPRSRALCSAGLNPAFIQSCHDSTHLPHTIQRSHTAKHLHYTLHICIWFNSLLLLVLHIFIFISIVSSYLIYTIKYLLPTSASLLYRNSYTVLLDPMDPQYSSFMYKILSAPCIPLLVLWSHIQDPGTFLLMTSWQHSTFSDYLITAARRLWKWPRQFWMQKAAGGMWEECRTSPGQLMPRWRQTCRVGDVWQCSEYHNTQEKVSMMIRPFHGRKPQLWYLHFTCLFRILDKQAFKKIIFTRNWQLNTICFLQVTRKRKVPFQVV